MGYEYNIKFKYDDAKEIAALLKSLPNFQEVKSLESRDQYIYHTLDNDGQLPNGLAEIDANGIYFCDYGDGEVMLKDMIFRVGLCYRKLEFIDHND